MKLSFRTVRQAVANYWPFFLFLAVMLWQHAYLYLYHDDFGYASLSYLGPLADGSTVQGHEFTLGQMLTFLKMHYLLWGGRVLPFFILTSMLRWSIWVFRILQSLTLTLILIFGAKLALGKDDSRSSKQKTALILVALYGLIPILIQNEGTYWATGSVLYAWPFLWNFGAGCLLQRYSNQPMHKAWLIPLFFLFWASGFSQEQVFFVAFFMLLGLLADHLLSKKSKSVMIADLVCILGLGLGYVLLMTAPGNQLRATTGSYTDYYALNLFERLRANLPVIFELIFGRSNLLIFIFLLLTNVITLVPPFIKRARGWVVSFILILIQVFYIVMLAGMSVAAFSILQNSPFGWWFAFMDHLRTQSILFWLTFVVLASIPPIWKAVRHKSYVMLGLYLGGIAALATNLFIPTVQYRSILVLFFPLFVVLAWMLTTEFKERSFQVPVIALIALMVIFAILNTGRILLGYQKNSLIQDQNQKSLILAGKAIENGSSIQEIHLQRLIDDRYAAKMPYEANYEYIDYWMRNYYLIPQDVELLWDK